MTIIPTTCSGSDRATALAVWGGLGAAGAAAGVVLGGVLTSWFGWQWVFFINVPIGAVAAGAALFFLPSSTADRRSLTDIDVAGALVLIAGLAVLGLRPTSRGGPRLGAGPAHPSFVVASAL